MNISLQEIAGIRKAISSLDERVSDAVAQLLETVGVSDPDRLRDAIIEQLSPICEEAAFIAEELAQSVYSAWRYRAIGEEMDTVAAEVWRIGKFCAMANTAALKASEGAAPDEVASIINNRSAYDIRAAYGETMRENARKDPRRVRYARIPSGADTCPFCLMLASRGFVYTSAKSAGEMNHYHANCDCLIVPSWDKTSVEGYDPDALYRAWKDSQEK